MVIKINKDSIICLMVFSLLFLNFPLWSGYNRVKYLMILTVAIYLCRYVRLFFSLKYIKVNCAFIIFSGMLLYSSYANRSIIQDRDPFLAALQFIVTMMEGLLFFEIKSSKGKIMEVINNFFNYLSIIIVLVDVPLFLFPNGNLINGFYIIGTKFAVVYFHIIYVALYFQKIKTVFEKLQIMKTLMLLLLTIVVANKVGCATGVVMVILLVLFFFFLKRFDLFILNPTIIISVLLGTFSFVFIYESVMKWNFIQTFIVDILHRDLTMSSRTRIFSTVVLLLKGHWISGLGYGTSYSIGIAHSGFPNTQNGILEWVWQCGLVGTCALLLFVYAIFKEAYKTKKAQLFFPVVVVIYIFSIISLVEISLSNLFFSHIMLLYAMAKDDVYVDIQSKK